MFKTSWSLSPYNVIKMDFFSILILCLCSEIEVYIWWRVFSWVCTWGSLLTISFQCISKSWGLKKKLGSLPNLVFYSKPILQMIISFKTSDLPYIMNFQMCCLFTPLWNIMWAESTWQAPSHRMPLRNYGM